MLVMGITGGTGAGKTTLLSAIERRGGMGIDCDALYYELLKTDAALRQSLTAAFGCVFLPDGSLDRKMLGETIARDAESRETLNAIVYPVIVRAVREKINRAKIDEIPLVGIDAINLLQSGLSELCDLTVAVIADAGVRLSRIVERDRISEDYATARIKMQENDRFFTENCTKILKNEADTEAEFLTVCDEFLENIIKEYEK